MEKIQRYFPGTLTVASLTFFQLLAGIRPAIVTSPNGNSVQIKNGKKLIFSSLSNKAAIILVQPEAAGICRPGYPIWRSFNLCCI